MRRIRIQIKIKLHYPMKIILFRINLKSKIHFKANQVPNFRGLTIKRVMINLLLQINFTKIFKTLIDFKKRNCRLKILIFMIIIKIKIQVN